MPSFPPDPAELIAEGEEEVSSSPDIRPILPVQAYPRLAARVLYSLYPLNSSRMLPQYPLYSRLAARVGVLLSPG